VQPLKLCRSAKETGRFMNRTKLIDRSIPDYTRGEEIFNMVSHIVGGAFAIIALVVCVSVAAAHNNIWGVVSGAIYGVTMVTLYTMSSVYHGLVNKGTSKKVMQVIDHCAIFLLIAGTYTPLTLCGLRPDYPALGWGVFGTVWALAILGVTLNAIDLRKYRVFSMICYIGMGWCVVAVIKSLLDVLPVNALYLLFGGGIPYTIGAVLYGLGRKIRFMHSVFHLFVVAGSILHFFCIVLYLM
jgi:hemolysin III